MQSDLEKCVEVLKMGGVILYPTDTIWGLGCDATNEAAAAKIFDIKKRVASKSMIVIVDGVDMLKDHCNGDITLALQHIEKANKPVTMIYPSAKNLATNVVAANGSIGIRIVEDEFCKQLISAFGKPVVSTSANISNEEFPSFFAEMNPTLIEAVDYVVQYRQDDTTKKSPSQLAIIEEDGTVKIIRE